jgi:hypothetical protein
VDFVSANGATTIDRLGFSTVRLRDNYAEVISALWDMTGQDIQPFFQFSSADGAAQYRVSSCACLTNALLMPLVDPRFAQLKARCFLAAKDRSLDAFDSYN